MRTAMLALLVASGLALGSVVSATSGQEPSKAGSLKREVVYLVGEVKNPGSYLFESDLTVRALLAEAGGPNDSAAPMDQITIRRGPEGKTVIHPKLSDPVLASDLVTVPRAR